MAASQKPRPVPAPLHPSPLHPSPLHPSVLTLAPALTEPLHPSGSQLDLPSMVTPTQLETLLNGLLSTEEKLPYSFHIEEQVRG